MTIIGLVLASTLTLLAGLHFYWALGGTALTSAVVPTRDGVPTIRPGPIACCVVGTALGLAAALCAARAALLPAWLPSWFTQSAVWLLAGVFFARAVGDFRYAGFFKSVRNSEFARRDSWLYSPLCVLLSALAASLALLAR